MQFQVPQFIEVEDQIFGPFTLSQFVYMAGGAGFTAMMIYFLPFYFAVIASIPFIGLSAALAFYKVNNRPLIDLVQSMLTYYFSNNLYIWKPKDAVEIAQRQAVLAVPKKQDAPQATVSTNAARNRLKDLAWSLDIKESSIYSDKKQR